MKDFFAYPDYANKTLEWLPCDTEEEYDKNIKKFPQFFKKYNWNKNSITYQFNSAGFRSDTFCSSDKSIIFLGCSHTIGIGMYYEGIFPKIVSNKLKHKCYNLGLGGGSLDSCFRFGFYWIEKLMPSIVVCATPQDARLELKIKTPVEHNFINFLPNDNTAQKRHKPKNTLYKQWVKESINVELQKAKNLNALAYICKVNNTKLIITDSGFPDYDVGRGLARDMNHYGAIGHKNKANQVLNLIDT